jgi:TusA-related sulfurtransferase
MDSTGLEKARRDQRAQFDLRGGSCGWCILKIKSLLKSLEPGQMIEVLVTDPATIQDLTAVLAVGPDRMLNAVQENGFNRIYVQKN